MISTQSINPMYLTGTAPVPGVQGVQGMPAKPNAFGINPAGNGVQSFAPQTPLTQAWATQASPTNAEETNAFVSAAFDEAKRLLAQSTAQQAQQPQTLAQPQATPTTVCPSASVAGLQVPTQPTAPATPTLQAGQSDGNGNILAQMPQTGQLMWVPEAQLLAMYQQAATAPEQLGKVQLSNGQCVSKATLGEVLAKLQARLTLKDLLAKGTITAKQFQDAGGNQDLKEVLAAGQKSQADKILAKRKEAQEYAASTRESIMSSQNPYASLGGTGGGGADVGSIG